ncbi:MAG: RHS domain-containing protein, partial [Gammaproteobacteria bacterium]|nr:RHS domain-containing protein [Gammaproteobacteria bacterium]
MRVVLLPAIGTAWFIQQSSDIQALLLLLGLIIVVGFKKAMIFGLSSPLKAGFWMLFAGVLISLSLVSTAVKAEDLYFIHNDHLGTAQVITDKDQAVVWQGDYQPFGEVEETIAVVENPTRFPGQYFDQETGLHYNWMRDYDPVLGRYLQSDSIGLGGGINTYGYAGQNPVRYYDPTGEYIWLLPL